MSGNVDLEVMNGPQAGNRIRLGKESIIFGRTDESHVVLDWDGLVSSRHFRIQEEDGCYVLRDLGSRNGTTINGNQVRFQELRLGDRIVAGQTLFVVVESNDEDSSSSSRPPAQAGLRVSAGMASGGKGRYDQTTGWGQQKSPVQVSIQELSPEIVQVEGVFGEDSSLVDVVDSLPRKEFGYLIIDFSKIGVPRPEGLDLLNCSLFPEMNLNVAANLPCLVSIEELPTWKEVLEEGWASDALILVESELEKAELLERLRAMIHVGQNGSVSNSKGILGFCWPTVLASLLKANSNDFTKEFFEFIESAFFEAADDDEGWRWFGAKSMADRACQNRWLVQQPSEQVG